ncbi:ATP-binding protein [Spirochaetota bacterium]
MKFKKSTVRGIGFLCIPVIMVFVLIVTLLYIFVKPIDATTRYLIFIGLPLLLALIAILLSAIIRYYYINRVKIIDRIVSEFKKGRFLINTEDIKGKDKFSELLRDLVVLGKNFDSIVSLQRDEIDSFHEFYNSIVFSISSFFIVIDEDEKIVFANDGFCKKFMYTQNEITGKKIDELFLIVNARLRGGIEQALSKGKTLILEKTHLLASNKISIISDVKISSIIVKGRRQIVILIDDVTNKLRKDYHISLMTQISESIQRDDTIERVFRTILKSITSGSGLGFNRAMLFLVDKENKNLMGKMAIGPDSFEEAIEIWSNVSSIDDLTDYESPNVSNNESEFARRVQGKIIPLGSDNILLHSLSNRKIIHVYDAWHDVRIDDDMNKFMDVKEFVIVPIITVQESIGVIIVDNKFNRVPVGNDVIELLSIFVSQAAISIDSHNSLMNVKKEMNKISDRQDAIVESEKMAAVGRIAAHIAHEIRNPLVTMGGYGRRIIQLGDNNPKIPETVTNAAKIIFKESERLEKILSNVMDFTKPTKLLKEFNNINDIIGDTLDLLRNVFLERKIEIITELNNEIPLLKCDSNQMKQVMLNIFQNSIDAISGKGSIFIQTTREDNNVLITIMDSGSGIDVEDPDLIFEPFYTTKVTGVGLGLANVKRIVKEHKGIIELDNNVDFGIEFKIYLPIPM